MHNLLVLQCVLKWHVQRLLLPWYHLPQIVFTATVARAAGLAVLLRNIAPRGAMPPDAA